jgi:SAM-dependent methyltransferase
MNLATPGNEWFEQWFDTKYYHLLYKHRNYHEAELFIQNLINFLNPSKDAYFLDVACGKGRHAVYLNKLGFKTDAFDLSPNNIAEAKKFENNSLHFYINDIRHPLKKNTYDYALNLFTSFGYFDSDDEDIKALQAINKSLKENGILVLDFLNVENLSIQQNNIVTQTIDNIEFKTVKRIENNFVIKDITVIEDDKTYYFQERVKLISKSKFAHYFSNSGFKILHTFGNYNLETFNPQKSERIIFIAQKSI